jgi:hypothetical protein
MKWEGIISRILEKSKRELKNKSGMKMECGPLNKALPSSNPLENYHYVYVQYLMVKQMQPLIKLSQL